MNALLAQSDYTPHKLTVDNLLTLERSGAFAGLPRLELLDGTLYQMSPQTRAHVRVRNRLTFALQSKLIELGSSYEAFSEATIIVDESSAPEPDIIICSDPIGDGFFPASTVLIAIEVALTSLRSDLNYKLPLYANAAIPEYWVVDVADRRIHQFAQPAENRYAKARVVDFGDMVTSLTIPRLTVSTIGFD